MRPSLPRITIGRLMSAVVVAAGFFALFRAVGLWSFVGLMAFGLVVSLMGLGPWFAARGDRRMAARTLAISSALGFAALAGLGVFSLNYLSVVYRMMASLVLMPFVIGCGVAWAVAATGPKALPRRRPLAAWSIVAGLVALPMSMTFTQWPIRAAFLASRPSLDRLADRVAAGGSVDRPEWAGLFRIRKVARAGAGPGTVSLVVENDPTGHTRVIRAPSPAVVPAVPAPAFLLDRLGGDGRWWYHELD